MKYILYHTIKLLQKSDVIRYNSVIKTILKHQKQIYFLRKSQVYFFLFKNHNRLKSNT